MTNAVALVIKYLVARLVFNPDQILAVAPVATWEFLVSVSSLTA